MVDSSMVSTRAPDTTITVLTKNCPIDAAPQARAKLSKLHRDGSRHGEANTSGFGFSAVNTAHTSGSTDTTAQAARITWKPAEADRSPAPRRRPPDRTGGGTSTSGRTEVMVTSTPPSPAGRPGTSPRPA